MCICVVVRGVTAVGAGQSCCDESVALLRTFTVLRPYRGHQRPKQVGYRQVLPVFLLEISWIRDVWWDGEILGECVLCASIHRSEHAI